MTAQPLARVCQLTPSGRGAIAVIRVWGPRALAITDAVFRPARGGQLASTSPGRLRLGRIGERLGDEVVAVIVPGDPPEVEIHCHGGPAAIALVLDALEEAGAERRQAVAWVKHSARSAIAAAAEVDLSQAPTVRTAEILLEQAQGALEDEVRTILSLLSGAPDAALAAIDALIGRGALGRRLISGWRVVLAGRPNVGKSRLLNALSGYERAIVSPTPGTTRDAVTVRIALAGWPVELSDTAGLRSSEDAIEASGIALARARQANADLVVVVLDRSEPLSDFDLALRSSPDALVVATKSDLAPVWLPDDPAVLTVSAERGDGIDGLADAIAARLVPVPPPPGSGVPFRADHIRVLERARASLASANPTAAAEILSLLLASPLPSGADV